ncbi:MAG: Mobile element protein, partial [uncultured Nocardioides sp.]
DPARRRGARRHARRMAIRRPPLPFRRLHGAAQAQRRCWHHRRARQRRV